MSIVSTVCATLSVALGATYMFAAEAPRQFILINAGALVVGMTGASLVRLLPNYGWRLRGAFTVAAGLLLIATAVSGVHVDGASRWLRVAGLSLQPSLIFLPMVMVWFARDRDWLAMLGLVLASVGLAMQPDRAMAGALACGLTILWLQRREWQVSMALFSAIAAFATTITRPDVVPPVLFVEHVVKSAFAFHLLAGLAVVAGLLTMLAPGAEAVGSSGDERAEVAVFATTWLAVIVASLLGNYPTPLVGYGSSAILGYCLSAAAIPDRRTTYSRAA